ncbi:MAG: hypothetical protein OXK80_03360 [Bdellovibrionales bacterium]|nr:hypothetical protein [Bdellovibrionales bacterium]
MFRLLFLLILFPFFAYASISIEPYVGGGLAGFGELHSGFSVGGRLGYKNWGLTSGVDVSYSQFQAFNIGQTVNSGLCKKDRSVRGLEQVVSPFCDENIEQTPENMYNIVSVGPSISFGLPLIIDAYASITWSWADKQIRNIQKSFALSGPGAKLGVSYLSLPFLQVNLEVQGFILSCNSMDNECQEQNNITKPIWMTQIYLSFPISTGLL